MTRDRSAAGNYPEAVKVGRLITVHGCRGTEGAALFQAASEVAGRLFSNRLKIASKKPSWYM